MAPKGRRDRMSDIALSDIDYGSQARMLSHSDNSSTLPRSRIPIYRSSEFESAFADASRRARDASAPIFIPTFTHLRRTIVEQLTASLHDLEQEIAALALNPVAQQEKVLEAVHLLRQLDDIVESEIKMWRLEDPQYAASKGLNLLHFDQSEAMQPRHQAWMMLNKAWGHSSRNVIEPITDNAKLSTFVSDHHQDQLKIRARVDDIKKLHPWTLRPKNTAERQRWTLHYDSDGSVKFRQIISWVWTAVLLFTLAALLCFYGVGIIATNSPFSPIFQKYFFWIAIVWSLVSSALLSWLVSALGGSQRDTVTAFMTGLGLWLVVIQIGQTHLSSQTMPEGG